jgi:hypothetical protein
MGGLWERGLAPTLSLLFSNNPDPALLETTFGPRNMLLHRLFKGCTLFPGTTLLAAAMDGVGDNCEL